MASSIAPSLPSLRYARPAVALCRVRRLPLARLATWATHGLVVWLYVWLATGGSFSLAGDAGYYGWLADAFLAGQTHLTIEPRPELLALPDPYNPVHNAPYRLHDALLYNGKYYLYWGPVPAVIRAASKAVTGIQLTDRIMVLVFGLSAYGLFWHLARELRDRAFRRAPNWLVLLVTLCYGVGGVSSYLLARPSMYHEAILGGTCFALAGLYVWLRALEGARPGPLLLAGLLFGLAVGSRFSMIGYAFGAGLVLLGRAWRARRRAALWPAVAFALPQLAILGLLLLYNEVRFGSFTEFGIRYILTGLNHHLEATYGGLQPATFPLNLAAYAAFVPTPLLYFPFFMSAPLGVDAAGVFWLREQNFMAVPLAAPLIILAPLSLAMLRPIRPRPSAGARAFVGAASVGIALSLTVLLFFHAATVRYLQDVVPVSSLLSGLVLYRLYAAWEAHPGRLAALRACVALTLVASVLVGLCLGMVGLSIVNTQAYLELAYRFDGAMSELIRRVAPDAWPASYLDPATAGRAAGTFYLEGQDVTLPLPAGRQADRLELHSVSGDPLRVIVEVDGLSETDVVIARGRQLLVLSPAIRSCGDTSSVRLRFPDLPQPAGTLRPIQLSALQSTAPSPPSAPAGPCHSPSPEALAELRRLEGIVAALRERVDQSQASVTSLAEDMQRLESAAKRDPQLEEAVEAKRGELRAARSTRNALGELLAEHEDTLATARKSLLDGR